jgi:hypothetical protein
LVIRSLDFQFSSLSFLPWRCFAPHWLARERNFAAVLAIGSFGEDRSEAWGSCFSFSIAFAVGEMAATAGSAAEYIHKYIILLADLRDAFKAGFWAKGTNDEG